MLRLHHCGLEDEGKGNVLFSRALQLRKEVFKGGNILHPQDHLELFFEVIFITELVKEKSQLLPLSLCSDITVDTAVVSEVSFRLNKPFICALLICVLMAEAMRF